MSQLVVECPGCHVQHPVPAIPPAGSALRCNACGHEFVTGQQPDLQPLGGYPTAPDPFASLAGGPSAGGPMGYDPFGQMPSQPLHGNPLMAHPSAGRSADGFEGWKIALIIGGSAVVLVFFAIIISAGMRRSGSTPPVAAAPVVVPPATPATTPAPAPTTPTTPASVTPQPSPTPAVATNPGPMGTAAATPLSNPATTGLSASLQKIRALPAVETKTQFTYAWKRGEKYRYGFEAKTEGNDSPGGKIGVVEYELTDLPREKGSQGGGDSDKPSASGTAFVVHSDGLLMTCNHVVAGASKLKVHINGKIHEAQVVAIDKPNDVAIIRIDATGLQPLPLANSDNVRLAEEVKAVGYPLATVLGRGVKITSGTIAGRIDDAEGPRLQVDITINPGNSGGPLVNNRGEVVGVNSAGLFGNSIQEVSFAVPSNLGRKLLDGLGVQGNGQASPSPISGPDLASRVTPGTAFVEVELGNESAVLLQFTGSSKGTGSSILPPQQITSRIAVGLSGGVLGAQQDLPLGLGLNTFGTMVLETLPEDGQKKWEEKSVRPLSMAGVNAGSQQVISLLLEEKVEYELKSIDDNQLVIGKKITVNTIGSSSLGSVKISGDGTWTFDRRAGVPEKMEMKIDSHVSIAGKTNDFRGTTRYQRLTKDNPTEWQSDIEKELAAVDPAGPDDGGLPELPELPPLSLEPSSESDVSAALKTLKNKKKSTAEYAEALESLSRMQPIPKRRDAVAAALHELRTTMAPHMYPWLLAARVWGTEKNMPTLLYTLDAPTSDINERILAMEAIARLPPTKESAKSVAHYLTDGKLRNNAVRAIGAMGPAGETPVAELLKQQPEQRVTACIILARIGTSKSVPVLESYLRGETDPRCRQAGTAALNMVRKRAAAEAATKKDDAQ